MIVNLDSSQLEIEVRDINYILPAYIRNYLFVSRNADPDRIVFPMFASVPHPYKPEVRIPIEWVPPLDSAAIAITEEGSNVPEATEQQIAELDAKDEEIKQLRAEVAHYAAAPAGHTLVEITHDEDYSPESATSTPFPNEPPPGRVPRMPEGGDIGPGASPDNMGRRDTRDTGRIKRDLKDDPNVDEAVEKPFEKEISRDTEGKPLVEG